MNDRTKDRQQVIRELVACQERLRQLEKQGRHQQQAVAGAKATYESVFELSPDALIIVDQQGRITRMNAQAEELFGYARGDLLGKDHGALVPQRLLDRHATEVKAYMEKPRARVMGIGLDLWGRRKDGSEFPADIDLGPLEISDHEFQVVAVVRDVTPRKKIEEDLLESEKRYRDLVELSPDTIIVTRQGKIEFVNDAGAGLFGVESPDKLVGQTAMSFVHPDYRQIAIDRLKQVEGGSIVPLIGEKIIRANGSQLDIEAISMPFTFRGQPAVLSIVRDVSERKKLEDELSRYQQRLEQAVAERTAELVSANERLSEAISQHEKAESGLSLQAMILDNAAEAIFLVNPRGGFAYANEAASEMYGYAPDEFLTLNMRELLPKQEAPAVEARLREVLRSGRLALDTVHIRKDGSVMPVQVRHSLIRTRHGEFIVSVVRDLSGPDRTPASTPAGSGQTKG
ncbi:MAG: PAS domain S-box protein [Chloroflexi bacterium]|nr:PAS domain S-box protein [Chloroflexota bacterium]